MKLRVAGILILRAIYNASIFSVKSKGISCFFSATDKVETISATCSRHDKVAIVLKKIATANNEDCTGRKLARSLRMDPNDLDVYLRHLMDRAFIAMNQDASNKYWYTTTAAGRPYLVKQGLL